MYPTNQLLDVVFNKRSASFRRGRPNDSVHLAGRLVARLTWQTVCHGKRVCQTITPLLPDGSGLFCSGKRAFGNPSLPLKGEGRGSRANAAVLYPATGIAANQAQGRLLRSR